MAAASYFLIYLAALCKESALMLIPALVVADKTVLRVPWRSLWRRHWPGVLVVGAWLLGAHEWLLRSTGGAVRSLREQLLTQAKALVYYAYKLAVPVHLNVEPQFTLSAQVEPAVALAGLCGLSAGLVAWRAATPVGLFLATLAVLWAVPTTFMPLNVLVNERRACMLVAVACVAIGTLMRRESP